MANCISYALCHQEEGMAGGASSPLLAWREEDKPLPGFAYFLQRPGGMRLSYDSLRLCLIVRRGGHGVRWHSFFSALALAGGTCLGAYAFYVWRHRTALAGASLVVLLAAAGWWSLAYALELGRSEEHTSDSSHLTISYAVFCLKKQNQ